MIYKYNDSFNFVLYEQTLKLINLLQGPFVLQVEPDMEMEWRLLF